MAVSFRPMRADDVLALDVQANQQIGLAGPVQTLEHGEHLVGAGPAWTATGEDGRVLTCAGFAEIWQGRQGLAWALLAEGIGAAHLTISRFARAQFASSPLRRIEAIVRADLPACSQWAKLVGMRFVAELPCWGPESGLHYLYERIR